jgi:hypothetical protein
MGVGMNDKLNERTIIDFLVRFDNGATHHEKSYERAMQFAKEMSGVGIYGSPVAITKHTRYVTSTYSDVCTFEEE